MTDIDHLLRIDAEHWKTSAQALPPDLDAAVRQTITVRNRSRHTLAMVCAAATVLAVAVAAAVAVPRLGGAEHSATPQGRSDPMTHAVTPTGPAIPVPAGVAASVIGPSGTPIPYAGTVPWRDAVRDTRDSRVVTVMADGDSMNTPIAPCGLPIERVHVHTVGAQASILIAGYALPSHVTCAGVGHPLQPLRVTLPAGTSLTSAVDAATSTTHTLLDAATARKAASPLIDGLTRTVRWDDRYGVVTTVYSDGNLGHGAITIDTGTVAQLASVNKRPFRTPQFAIGNGYATTHHASGANGAYFVYWTASASRAYAVNITAVLAGKPITMTDVESICRSVH